MVEPKMKLEVLWRQLVESGEEHLILSMDAGVHADSLSVGEIESTAYRIHYEIDCDANWNVQRVEVEDLLNGKVTFSAWAFYPAFPLLVRALTGLGVAAGNPRAIRFYEKMGYRALRKAFQFALPPPPPGGQAP